jgi:hypothetical protein
MLGLISGGALALCCGGVLAIGAISGPPDQAADQKVTVADPAGQPLPAAPAVSAPKGTPPLTAVPSGTNRSTPSRTVTSRPTTAAPKMTTTRPKPSPTRTTRKPTPKTTTKAPTAVYYKNCAAVRAAGADPIYRGDPGYGRHLDRDGDGVGCE